MFDYFIMFKSEGKFKRATLEEIRDIYLPLGGKTKTLTDRNTADNIAVDCFGVSNNKGLL